MKNKIHDPQMVKERKAWLKKHRLTPTRFAHDVGEEPGTVYKWFTLGRTPRKHYLDNVLSVYPNWPRHAR